MTRRVAWSAVFAIAAAGALAPLPDAAVERWYSNGLYPAIQHALTRASNLVPFAIFDVLCVGAIVATALCVYRAVRGAGWRRGMICAGGDLARAAAVLYIAFLAAWGLNYRRVPLTEKLVFDPSRITTSAASQLGDRAVATLNRLYGPAHASPTPLDSLESYLRDALRTLGGPRSIVAGRPKQTLFGEYFHQASVAGMTDPFFLETLIAPDLFDVERPFVIAHEWAHLAGYADESEANFAAYLACRRGDAAAQYSAALMLIGYVRLSRPLSEVLQIGPQTDLFAIRYRYSRTNETLRFAAREGYDKYLKANRVQRGVESYDAVLQLILGTEFDADGRPRVR
jgi:hypothetical protein